MSLWKGQRRTLVTLSEDRLAIEEAMRYTRNTWYRVLDNLLAIPAKSDNPAVKQPGAEFKQFMVALWRDHGKCFGLKEATERRRFEAKERPERRKLDPPCMPCNWMLCSCADHEPPHKMHVCKGCWEAFYCSKACQERCVIVHVASGESHVDFIPVIGKGADTRQSVGNAVMVAVRQKPDMQACGQF